MSPTNLLRKSNVRPKAKNPAPSAPVVAKREILIRAGRAVVRARLLDTPTADRIWQQLPFYGTVETWGQSIHFETHVETGRDTSARQSIKAGDIVFWVERDRVMMAWGETPISRHGEIRLPAPANVWAKALDDVAVFDTVTPGERVSMLQADG